MKGVRIIAIAVLLMMFFVCAHSVMALEPLEDETTLIERIESNTEDITVLLTDIRDYLKTGMSIAVVIIVIKFIWMILYNWFFSRA